ncbi:MAG: FxsA family protein [Pseudomonadota bacterium]
MPPLVRPALLLVVVALPLLEIALLIKLGQAIGFWPTLALVVGSALLGARVVHNEGFATLARVNAALAADETPIVPVAEGALMLLAGMLLIVPGVLTDGVGLALLIPMLRRRLALLIVARANARADVGVTVFTSEDATPWPDRRARASREGAGTRMPDGGLVIDGEFERLEERTVRPAPRNGSADRRD